MMSALVRGMLFTDQARGADAGGAWRKADGRGGAGDGGDDGGQNGHQQRGLEGVQHRPVQEQFGIPVQGEAAPYRVGLGVVEGKDDQHEDGGIEEEEHDDQKKPLETKSVLFSQDHRLPFTLAEAVHDPHAHQDDDHHHQGDGRAQMGVVGGPGTASQ